MVRNISRRTLLKGSAGAAAAGAAAVASKRSRAFAAPNVIKQAGSNIEIDFWYGFGGNLGDRVAELIENFNSQNTGVVVNGLQQASYEETAQNLTLALQDGTFPAVAVLSDVWWFRFYLADAIMPLDDFIGAGNYDIDDIVDSFRIEGVRQGQQYWLPFARSTPLVYYNKDMFDAAGISAFPQTWSEFEEIAPSLVNESEQVYALAHPPSADYLAWPFQGIVWAYGGAYSDPDFTIRIHEEGAVNAGRLYQRSIENGWAYTTENNGEDLANGFAAVAMASTGSLVGLTEVATANGINLGTAFLPGEVEGIDLHCSTGGSGFSIMTNLTPEEQEAAFSFIEFANSYENTIWWSQNTGYMPVRKSAIEGPEMAEFFTANPNFKTAVDQLPFTKPQDTARVFVPGGDQIIGRGIEQILVNGEDPQVAFEAVRAELEPEAQAVREQVIAREGELGTPAA
jgi:sn-glycerol 3-phosphate transport system substrate-binding protein